MSVSVALNAAFVRLGFSAEAAVMLADPIRESIDIMTLQYFDDKGVTNLCATLRKPGGMIEGTNRGEDGVPIQVPNPGMYVSTRAEMNLTYACYMARHFTRTTRTLIASDLTVENVQRYAQYKEVEDNFKEPDDVMRLTKPEKILEFIEEWPAHLALYNGQNGKPLAYVIRDQAEIPLEMNDPTFGEDGSKYASLRDEIMSRASHSSPQFMVDNARVFDILNIAINEHKHVKTWIKSFALTQNGRSAWFNFKAHFRGSSELEAIEAAAENRMESLIYRGEKPRYNFETHVSMHQKSYLEIENATGQIIPGPTKVRKLLKSIQASNLMVPVATIRAQENLRSDFDSSVNYLRAFISSVDQESRNVLMVDMNNNKRKGSDRKSRRPIKKERNEDNNKTLDRYYKPTEWWNLDAETRERVLQARKKRGIAETSQVRAPKEENEEVQKTQRKPVKCVRMHPSVK